MNIASIKLFVKFILKLVFVRLKLFIKNTNNKYKSSNKPIILFMCPDADLKPHYMAHCILARTLRLLGYDARFLRCYKKFDRCTVIEGKKANQAGKPVDKNITCVDCAYTSLTWANKYDIPTIEMSQYNPTLPYSDAEIADAGKNLKYEEIPFGEICITDILRNYKLSEENYIMESLLDVYVGYVKDALKNYLIFKEIIKEYKISSVVYFGDYSFYFGVILKCMKDKINFSTLHQPAIFGIRRDNVVIEKSIWGHGAAQLQPNFGKWKSVPLATNLIQDIGFDILHKMENKNLRIYSPPKTFHKDLFEDLKIPLGKKVLVAYTSSTDEINALISQYNAINFKIVPDGQPFKDQIDWITQLVQFVESSSLYYLIIRIHPREHSARDGITSQHLHMLKLKFENVNYQNAMFIWPESTLSSYDLAEIADLVLVSWSNIGSDLERLGVPVIASFNMHWVHPYPSLKNPDDYFTKIREANNYGSLDNIKEAFRWFYLRYLGNSVDISDIVKEKDCWQLPPKFNILPKESKLIEKVLCGEAEPLTIKYQQSIQVKRPEDYENEDNNIKKMVLAYIYFLLHGEIKQNFTEALLRIKSPELIHTVLRDDTLDSTIYVASEYPYITYISKSKKLIKKRSPLISRLVNFSAWAVNNDI